MRARVSLLLRRPHSDGEPSDYSKSGQGVRVRTHARAASLLHADQTGNHEETNRLVLAADSRALRTDELQRENRKEPDLGRVPILGVHGGRLTS